MDDSKFTNFFISAQLSAIMEEFDVEQFFTITFDIMERIAAELEPVKKEEYQHFREDPNQAFMDFSFKFRQLMANFQPELMEKYGLSFVEYNEDTKIYREVIDNYCEGHPETREKYENLRKRLLFQPSMKNTDDDQPKKPKRFPFGDA